MMGGMQDCLVIQFVLWEQSATGPACARHYLCCEICMVLPLQWQIEHGTEA